MPRREARHEADMKLLMESGSLASFVKTKPCLNISNILVFNNLYNFHLGSFGKKYFLNGNPTDLQVWLRLVFQKAFNPSLITGTLFISQSKT
jgi:hypothetical protein